VTARSPDRRRLLGALAGLLLGACRPPDASTARRSAADDQPLPPPARPPPASEWRWPTVFSVEDRGIKVVNLGTVIESSIPGSTLRGPAAATLPPHKLGEPDPLLDHLAQFLLFVVEPGGVVSPETPEIHLKHSLSGRLAGTYTQLVSRDGLTIGLLQFLGPRQPRHSVALELGAFRVVSAGATTIVRGSWEIGLFEQVVDRVAGRTASPGLPTVDVRGTQVRFQADTMVPRVVLQAPSGQRESFNVRLNREEGVIRLDDDAALERSLFPAGRPSPRR
jgi:hypothetical protein